jgi:DOMON domain
LNFEAEVEPGTWLSVGWGWHMFDCDMVLCQAYQDIRRSLISDLWSTQNTTPLFDTLDNYFNNHIEFNESTGMQHFTFSRAMDTGDATQDYVVEIDQEIKICYAINTMTPDFV